VSFNPLTIVARAVLLALLVAGTADASSLDAQRFMPIGLTAVEPLVVPYAPSVAQGDWQPTQRAREQALLLRSSPLEDLEERARRVREFTPGAEGRLGPGGQRRWRAALQSAAIFEAVGDHKGALFAYERAVALGARDVGHWRSLARARRQVGDGPGAEAALLAALDRAEHLDDPISIVEWRAQIHRELALVYLLDGRRRDARIALEAGEGLVSPGPVIEEWRQRNLVPIDLSPRPRPHAPRPVWPADPEPDWRTRALAFARGSERSLPPVLHGFLDATVGWLAVGGRERMGLFAALGVIALALGLRMLRQRGDMTVAIEYPEELRGVFRVRLVNSRTSWRTAPRASQIEVQKGGVSTRHEHHLVNRETHFQRLLTRRYHVTVEGMLLDPENDEAIDSFYERKTVRVRHRRTVRLEFNARPEHCPVDIQVLWHDKPAEDVGVVVRDLPDSLRQGGGSSVRMMVSKGHHLFVIGCEDRVMERDVEVASYRPTRVRFDLAAGGEIFKGCPPAVEPYLRGDIETVARALERDGQAIKAYLMLAHMHHDRGDDERAADYFESAGESLAAADLRAELGDYARAATLYLEVDDPIRAAEMHKAAGDLVLAGQAYEIDKAWELAIECYREAGEIGRWINALDRQGEIFQAANLALEHDQRRDAMSLLQRVLPEDPNFAEALLLLVAGFEREGHFDMAVVKMEQHIATYKLGTAPPDKYSRLADLREAAGQIEAALEVLEDLRRREPTYPQIASRIETLRKQRSAAGRVAGASGEAMSSGSAPTAFVSESRYEIIEEVGRGGMGIVFKARDRRLDRVVALKRLPEDLRRHHPRAVQLFLREAQAAARLNHPNIVTVYDTDQEDGSFFITMELLDGEPFQRILKERGRLTSASAVSVALQVAAGLQYAHEQGIVHRDIKTANLFLTTDKVVKIMDFGLAKMFEEVRGGTTVISGTPFYMSPEQIVGLAVDQRTDLYSLGITLFELVTGQVPFSQGDIAYHHRHSPPPDPRDLVEDLPDALAELLSDLLEKDVESRCPSAGALVERLEALKLELLETQ
jgi:tetratricopeptide (TPR) repeat protein